MKASVDKFVMSQSGVYRLHQLAHQVHTATGVRHKLSDHDSLLNLLDFSSHCSNSTIQTYLAAFTSELDSEVVDELEENGVLPVRH